MEEGTQFGRYRLESKLGAGAMGEVYRAFDTETDRTVAVKVLVPHLAEDEKFQARFRQEARTAASLNDPHVVPIHNFGEIDGHLYVDMRLIEGRDLGAVIANAPMAPDKAVSVVEQIASALDAAHQAGLVHRDVKPSNILLTERNFAYLIDFGIARGAESSGMTSVGHTIGTLAYMAPERFESGNADPRADIYALACVLHECLTGRRPFDAESLEQQIAAHMMAPPPRASVLQLQVPAALDTVIARGMAKNPNQRYRTAPELGNAARAALSGQGIGGQRPPGPPAPPAPQPPRPAPAGYSHPQLTKPQPPTQQRPGAYTSSPYGVVARPPQPGQGSGPHRLTGPQPAGPQPPGPQGPHGQGPQGPHGPHGPGGPSPQGSWFQRNVVAVAAAVVAVITAIIVVVMVATSDGGPPPGPEDLATVLLTTDELNDVLGVDDMTPTIRYFALPEDESRITPDKCYAISYAAGIKSYEDSGYIAMREELAGGGGTGIDVPGIDQSIFQFPSAAEATAFLDSMSQDWQSCLDTDVISKPTDSSTSTETKTVFTDFVEADNMITVSSNPVDDANSAPCKRTLAAKGAYVADVRVCVDGVGDESEAMVEKMFERVPA